MQHNPDEGIALKDDTSIPLIPALISRLGWSILTHQLSHPCSLIFHRYNQTSEMIEVFSSWYIFTRIYSSILRRNSQRRVLYVRNEKIEKLAKIVWKKLTCSCIQLYIFKYVQMCGFKIFSSFLPLLCH